MPDCLLHGSHNSAGHWYKDAPRGIAVSTVKGSNEEWQGRIGRHRMLWHEARDRYFLCQLYPHTVEAAAGKAMQRSCDIAEGETLLQGDFIQAIYLSWLRSNQCTVIWKVYISQSQVIQEKLAQSFFSRQQNRQFCKYDGGYEKYANTMGLNNINLCCACMDNNKGELCVPWLNINTLSRVGEKL